MFHMKLMIHSYFLHPIHDEKLEEEELASKRGKLKVEHHKKLEEVVAIEEKKRITVVAVAVVLQA